MWTWRICLKLLCRCVLLLKSNASLLPFRRHAWQQAPPTPRHSCVPPWYVLAFVAFDNLLLDYRGSNGWVSTVTRRLQGPHRFQGRDLENWWRGRRLDDLWTGTRCRPVIKRGRMRCATFQKSPAQSPVGHSPYMSPGLSSHCIAFVKHMLRGPSRSFRRTFARRLHGGKCDTLVFSLIPEMRQYYEYLYSQRKNPVATKKRKKQTNKLN